MNKQNLGGKCHPYQSIEEKDYEKRWLYNFPKNKHNLFQPISFLDVISWFLIGEKAY